MQSVDKSDCIWIQCTKYNAQSLIAKLWLIFSTCRDTTLCIDTVRSDWNDSAASLNTTTNAFIFTIMLHLAVWKRNSIYKHKQHFPSVKCCYSIPNASTVNSATVTTPLPSRSHSFTVRPEPTSQNNTKPCAECVVMLSSLCITTQFSSVSAGAQQTYWHGNKQTHGGNTALWIGTVCVVFIWCVDGMSIASCLYSVEM